MCELTVNFFFLASCLGMGGAGGGAGGRGSSSTVIRKSWLASATAELVSGESCDCPGGQAAAFRMLSCEPTIENILKRKSLWKEYVRGNRTNGTLTHQVIQSV